MAAGGATRAQQDKPRFAIQAITVEVSAASHRRTAPLPNTSALYSKILKLRVWITNSNICGTRPISSFYV